MVLGHIIFYQRFTDSSTKAGRVYSVNTVYVGKCFLISPGISEYQQQEKMLKPPNIAISLPTDDSRVQAYIIRDDSENALILDYWHYPIKPLELKNNMFMGLSLTKEYHIRIPREDSPCNKIPEKSYYKVSCPKCYFIHHNIINSICLTVPREGDDKWIHEIPQHILPWCDWCLLDSAS